MVMVAVAVIGPMVAVEAMATESVAVVPMAEAVVVGADDHAVNLFRS